MACVKLDHSLDQIDADLTSRCDKIAVQISKYGGFGNFEKFDQNPIEFPRASKNRFTHLSFNEFKHYADKSRIENACCLKFLLHQECTLATTKIIKYNNEIFYHAYRFVSSRIFPESIAIIISRLFAFESVLDPSWSFATSSKGTRMNRELSVAIARRGGNRVINEPISLGNWIRP